jgi:PTS system cellobiose-specific IIC component
MEKEKSWFDKNVVPAMNKFANARIPKSISNGFQSGMNVLMVGAMLTVLSIIMGFIPGIKDSQFLLKFNILKDIVFGVVGILFAYGVAAADAKAQKMDERAAGFLAIVVYFIFMNPTLTVNEQQAIIMTAPFAKFGMQGVLVAIISGFWAAEVSALFKKKGWIVNADGLPDIAKVWFEYMIAGVIIVIGPWVVTHLLNIDLYTIFTQLLSPLMNIFGSFWGWTLAMVLSPLFFYFGIHPMTIVQLIAPIYVGALAHNVELLNQGIAPTLANGFFIANIATWNFLNIGGTGSTLGLNILLLFSKNKGLKKLGRLAFLPSLLNINEPLLFGIPILYNPVFLIPFVLGTAINSSITFLVMSIGLVNIPATYALAPNIPAPLNGYIITQDWKAVILILTLIVLDIVIWAPFVKIYEKKMNNTDSENASGTVSESANAA